MKHAQYYRNIANGIARIAQAVTLCDLAPVETGTIFSKRFKKQNSYNCTIIIPDGLENMYNGNPEYFQYSSDDISEFDINPQQKYEFSLSVDNVDQDTIDALRELSKPDSFIHGIDDCGSLFSAN